MPSNEKSGRPRRHSTGTSRSGTGCASTLEQVEMRRDERRNKATPWILLKAMVLVVFGLIGFTAYTYIGRFLLPGLREEKDYPFSRSTCIGLLAGYCIVLLMFIWAYCRIIFTSPGYAVDHVAKTPSPTTMPEPATIPGYRYQNPVDVEAGTQSTGYSNGGHAASLSEKAAAPVIRPDLQRRPNPTPVLREEYRYCYREGFVKPKRTHHCRACGKCVLAYDHHCPWIGQCVGARNMRYFFVFLEWTLVYCVYVLVSLVISVTRRGRDIDGAQIATIALAALFTLFMIGMMSTHVRLIMINQTTVESMGRQGLREEESALLNSELSCWDARSRRLIGKRWNAEWGNPDTEGNIWWLGSSSANWKARMGDNPLGWFLPLATHNPTGLDYDVNPRFDSDGRWRRREQWPVELR